jgi:hypothetical protein
MRKRKCHPHCKVGRHVFTHEESVRGYQAAILKLVEKHPDWVCQHGAHFSHCLLRVKNPLWFEVRKLEGQLKRLTAKVGKQDTKLRSIRKELRKLKKTKGYDYVTHTTKPKRKVKHNYVN